MKLLATEDIGGRIERWWLHVGDDGKDRITVETVQDVEPIFRHVEVLSDAHNPKSDFHFRASIPATVIEEMCRVKGLEWGCRSREVFSELMLNKTKRAQRIWRMLMYGRDYRKLQRA